MKFFDKLYYVFITIIFGYFVYTYYKKYYAVSKTDILTVNNVDDYYYKDILVLKTLKKPKIWVHIPFSKNSRHWESFGSRTTENLNIPFIYLSMKTIIDACGDKFDVILYDDTNIPDILQEDSEFEDIEKLSGVLLNKFREVSKARILHKYGGIHLPCSLIMKSFSPEIMKPNKFIACRIANERVNSSNLDYVVSSKILGCKKGCNIMSEYITYLKELDYSVSKETFESNEYLLEHANILSEEYIGCKDINENMVHIERLFSNEPIQLSNNHVALFVNLDELLIRSKYQWFLRMSINQIYASKDRFFLASYIHSVM
mgnify:CR=1 FL=1